MRNKRRFHLLNYAGLVVLLATGALFFFAVWPDRFWMRVICIGGGFVYLGWGLATHAISDTVSPRIFWEYLGISLLGTALLWMII